MVMVMTISIKYNKTLPSLIYEHGTTPSQSIYACCNSHYHNQGQKKQPD